MSQSTQPAPAPKKRSLFKRAPWQDEPKKEGNDMFSHANEFGDIVADQDKRRKEKQEEKQRRHAERDKKRRKVSLENKTSGLADIGPGTQAQSNKSHIKKSQSPLPTHASLDWSVAPDDLLTKHTTSISPLPKKEQLVVDLDDYEDELPIYKSSFDHVSSINRTQEDGSYTSTIPLRATEHPLDDNLEPEEVLDPSLAALQARARMKAALKAEAATAPIPNGGSTPAPISELFIKPQIPNANPLIVKVRIDSTLEKPRKAWCDKQGFSEEMTKSVFLTWKNTRMFDSTTIRRLGIQIDARGNVSVEGDSNIYDDVNVPRVLVEAWTEEIFQKRKKEDDAEAAAKQKATEPLPTVEDKEPTPEPTQKARKIRLILKAKGKADYGLIVNPETDFGYIASAYKQAHNVQENQPITLMFDGDRLPPMDTVDDVGIENMDAIEVLFR